MRVAFSGDDGSNDAQPSHPGDVAYVWVDGLLYRKGEYLTLDVDRIRYEAERRAFRMVGKPMTSMREYRG